MNQSRFALLGLFVKGILAGIAYLLGTMLAGMLFTARHITLVIPKQLEANPHLGSLLFALMCPLLGLAMVPLARHTAGSRLVRGLSLFFLIFISLGINMAIETKIFLTIYAHGGALAAAASVFPPALLLGLVLSFLLAQEKPETAAAEKLRSFFAAHSPASWVWRFLLVILAFPIVYLFFGAIVAPFVVPYYRAGVLDLTLPSFSVMLPVMILRSTLFSLASLPFLILWGHTWRSLIVSLGLAHWFLTGLFGLVQVFWWPMVMRIGHSLEIGADSFVYAAVLVFLLFPRPKEISVTAPAQATPLVS